ncbi:8831_t:CDS:10, partial [Acaulospora morrowiae]
TAVQSLLNKSSNKICFPHTKIYLKPLVFDMETSTSNNASANSDQTQSPSNQQDGSVLINNHSRTGSVSQNNSVPRENNRRGRYRNRGRGNDRSQNISRENTKVFSANPSNELSEPQVVSHSETASTSRSRGSRHSRYQRGNNISSNVSQSPGSQNLNQDLTSNIADESSEQPAIQSNSHHTSNSRHRGSSRRFHHRKRDNTDRTANQHSGSNYDQINVGEPSEQQSGSQSTSINNRNYDVDSSESRRHRFKNRPHERNDHDSQNVCSESADSQTLPISQATDNVISQRGRPSHRRGRYRAPRSSNRTSGTHISQNENRGIPKDSITSQVKNNDGVISESSPENFSSKVQSLNYTENSQSNNSDNGPLIISDNKGKKPEPAIAESSSSQSNSNLNSKQKHSRNNYHPKKSSVYMLSPSDIKDVRTSITHGLTTSTYECMICCEVIKPHNKTWFCGVCWAVFHLSCTQKWANKSIKDAGSWRCPGCQNRTEIIPDTYQCFCGKKENPPNSRYFTPHSCGEVCGRKRDCPHDCTQLCHPGPCDRNCYAMGPVQNCFCGRQKLQLLCINTDYSGRSCGSTCEKLLECGKHYCEQKCHDGVCSKCDVIELQKCYCGRSEREIKCGERMGIHCYDNYNDNSNEWTGFFSCDRVCARLLECGKHFCTKICHPITGETEPCPSDPSKVQDCPCGAHTIEELLGRKRISCDEEIPLCGNICGKILSCGHLCTDKCHHGDCKPCSVIVTVKCRCGSTEFERACCEVVGEFSEPPLCEKICKGLRSCGKHQCNVKCCPSANVKQKQPKRWGTPRDGENDTNHLCPLLCGKMLQCGNHTCQLLCHREQCMSCLEASFEELSCNCGRTKVYPPIPCGMKVPKCQYECNRNPSCGHAAVSHLCHSDEEPCPPCPYLVNDKMCMCAVEVIDVDELVILEIVLWEKNASRPVVSLVKHVVILAHIHAMHQQENFEEIKDRRLECSESCAMVERNRKLASALELNDRINEGDLIKAIPEYEEDLLRYYSSNKDWAKNIENSLNEFLMKPNKTLNFQPMKSTHRKFIHELCVHYRLSSCSFDVDPYRSVVVTKKPDSAIPPLLLSQVFAKQGKLGGQSLNATSSSTTIEQSARKTKQPVNALYLSELATGLTKEELQKLLDPLLGKLKFQIKWVNDEDVVLIPFVGSMHMDDLESQLVKLKLSAKDSLISKGIVTWVELCWINSKYEVVWRERSKLLHGPNVSASRVVASSVSIGSTNPYVALMNFTDRSHTNGLSDVCTKSSSDNTGTCSKQIPKSPVINNGDSIVDDWELLSDD